MKNDNADGTRIAIAAFIVATTFTAVATDFIVPKILFIPAVAFLSGLIITAILAFLFILAKGYELRYKTKERNTLDKYNYILYNLALTAYAIVAAVILFAFSYNYLGEASKAGNALASLGMGFMFIMAVVIISRKDIKELVLYVRKQIKKRLIRK